MRTLFPAPTPLIKRSPTVFGDYDISMPVPSSLLPVLPGPKPDTDPVDLYTSYMAALAPSLLKTGLLETALAGGEDERLTLDWVNAIRTEHGIGPAISNLLGGRIKNKHECPIARALDHKATVYRDKIMMMQYNNSCPVTLRTPNYVRRFVARFDHEFYPNLITA